jgi:hypothetical protein
MIQKKKTEVKRGVSWPTGAVVPMKKKRLLQIIWAIRSRRVFRNVTDTNMQYDKSQVFVGNNIC